jgi:hypothetical protein
MAKLGGGLVISFENDMFLVYGVDKIQVTMALAFGTTVVILPFFWVEWPLLVILFFQPQIIRMRLIMRNRPHYLVLHVNTHSSPGMVYFLPWYETILDYTSLLSSLVSMRLVVAW